MKRNRKSGFLQGEEQEGLRTEKCEFGFPIFVGNNIQKVAKTFINQV
jgi:hypothetical protein